MFPRIIPNFRDLRELAKDAGYSFATSIGSVSQYVITHPKQVVLLGVTYLFQTADALLGKRHSSNKLLAERFNRASPQKIDDTFFYRIVPITMIGASTLIIWYCVANREFRHKRKLLQQEYQAKERLKQRDQQIKLETQEAMELRRRQRRERAMQNVNADVAQTPLIVESQKVGKPPKGTLPRHQQANSYIVTSHDNTRSSPVIVEETKQEFEDKNTRTPSPLPVAKEKKPNTYRLFAFARQPVATKTIVIKEKKSRKNKPTPTAEQSMKFIKINQQLFQKILMESKTENPLESCLRYTALLFVIPRIYIAVSFYLDEKNLKLPNIISDTAFTRLLFQHATMEVDVKTMSKIKQQLNQTLTPTILQLELPEVKVKGQGNGGDMFSVLKKGFDRIEKKGLIANNESDDVAKLNTKDEQYHSWIKHKIIPMINLFAKDLITKSSDTNLMTSYPSHVMALKKLFSFIGEYYKKARHQRFEKLDKEGKLHPKGISGLLRKIRLSVRNKVEHLDPDFLDVIDDGKLLELCKKIKAIYPEVADLSDFNDDFTYSFESYKRKHTLNPLAAEFVPRANGLTC